jgi:hypothetical protein
MIFVLFLVQVVTFILPEEKDVYITETKMVNVKGNNLFDPKWQIAQVSKIIQKRFH